MTFLRVFIRRIGGLTTVPCSSDRVLTRFTNGLYQHQTKTGLLLRWRSTTSIAILSSGPIFIRPLWRTR